MVHLLQPIKKFFVVKTTMVAVNVKTHNFCMPSNPFCCDMEKRLTLDIWILLWGKKLQK